MMACVRAGAAVRMMPRLAELELQVAEGHHSGAAVLAPGWRGCVHGLGGRDFGCGAVCSWSHRE
jgi:hypothetical protein